MPTAARSPDALNTLTLSPDDARYLALWTASPQRSPFSHPGAVEAYGAAFGLRVRVLGIPAEDGALVAAAPVFEKRRGPFVASALPPLCPVHTPLLAARPSDASVHARTTPLDALLAAFGSRYAQATFHLAATLPDVRPFPWAGWAVAPRSTYTLDLCGDLEAGFSTAVRRTLRRDAGAFDIAEGIAPVPDLARLVDAAYARSAARLGVRPATTTALVRALAVAGLARVVAAVRGGVAEAVVAVASDGETAFYWIAGSVPGPAMTVLLGALLPRLATEGVHRFDFCGANTPTIAEFKRRFGPVLAPAPLATVVPSRTLRALRRLRP